MSTIKKSVILGLVSSAAVLAASTASAAIVITEVQPSSSGNAPYAADWFEVTNTGQGSVDITDWKIDDSSNAFATAVSMRGITSIGAGQSVIFLEGLLDGSTDATIAAAFRSAWFGANPPATLSLGFYGGSGVGLSTGGDAVNLYNAAGVSQASVTFGASDTTSPFSTFDNSAGLSGAIAQQSAVGVNGAFLSANGVEIGSPGSASPVPLPAGAWLLLSGLGALGAARRKRALA